ncbi:hypothetical protein [Candidatus Nitrotoga arctica]|uniref:Uncharacterized protein n=1 Tax=Candidatus Nitrotoga arctica TaxID=453162 RepID=A0ABN8AID4_9PROT|nr:hypothetical protein [Candidatus Nitrotoga arctica]CAG9931549.1 protein of unknown function [Candidatus Nitrotoga arctica]
MDVENVYETKNPLTHKENAGLCISLDYLKLDYLKQFIGGIGAIESLARNRAIGQSAC